MSKTLEKWDDVHAFDRRRWIWRGHRCTDWDIKTSIERFFERTDIPEGRRAYVETELLREFTRTYHQWSDCVPEMDRKVEWLSIMQHHGAPTRLVDFSYSVYVALYFALEAATADCAIWGIDCEWAAKNSIEALRNSAKPDIDQFERNSSVRQERAASEALFAQPNVRLAMPLNPYRMNERLRVQKGMFMVPGDIRCSFMDNLRALPGFDSEDHVVKLVVPDALRREAIERLFYMNVSRTSLFPGLDGYAQSLSVFHPCVNPEIEIWPQQERS